MGVAGGEQPLPALDRAQGRAYALAAFREQTRRVAEARVGTRNDTLNRAAFSLGRLVAAHLIPPLPVVTGLAEAAARAGLPEEEARRTIRSGMAAAARKLAPGRELSSQAPRPKQGKAPPRANLAASVGLARAMARLLYGISPTDSVTYAAVSLLWLAVAMAACYFPARRAAHVDPTVALRYE